MLKSVPGIISVKGCYQVKTSQWDSVTSRKNFQIWHPLSLAQVVMPWLGSAQLSSAKHGLTKMGQAKPSHS